jgi:hypothetical protein
VVVLAVLLQSTAWCIPHLGVSYVDHNSSIIVAISNYTTVEEIPTGEEVLVGTFFLNKHLVIILFDSGTSLDFISFTCAKKAMLSTVAAEAPYVISTPRGRVDADWIVRKAPLELAGRVFSTDLSILKGQGLDVILGMT